MRFGFKLGENVICWIKSGFKGINGTTVPAIKDLDPVIIDLTRRSKYRKKVASEYGWSESTFKRKLNEKKIKLPPGKICPADLRKIYLAFGPPIPTEHSGKY